MRIIRNFMAGKNRQTTILIIVAVAILYILLSVFLFKSDPIIYILSSIDNAFLLVYEGFANLLLGIFKSSVFIDYHYVIDIKSDMELSGFTPELRLKKWSFTILLVVWLTKAPSIKKIYFSLKLLLVHFVTISIYIAIGANMLSSENNNIATLSIPLTIAILSLVTLFLTWYKKYKEVLLSKISKIRVDPAYFKNNFKVFTIIYIYIILVYFIIEFFDFKIWVSFILNSAKDILHIMGRESVVEPFRIVGQYGNIYLVKGCLGFQTMFVFAILVYLTGKDNFYRWGYITTGLIILNIINIFRFVILFIHIENNKGMYILGIELHDIYNYAVYLIIFLLWVIWFDKFSKMTSNFKFRQKA